MAGQHRVGKHTAKGQAAAKAQPRIPKKAAKAELPVVPKGQVYQAKGKGFVSRLLNKGKDK